LTIGTEKCEGAVVPVPGPCVEASVADRDDVAKLEISLLPSSRA